MKSKLILLSMVLASSVFAQWTGPYTSPSMFVTATNITGARTSLQLSTRANIKQIMLGASSGTATLKIYDQNTLADPYFGTNVVVPSYWYSTGYATNIYMVVTNEGGYTNVQTNVGYWTYNVTNTASTNELQPVWIGVVQPNTVVAFDANLLNSRGIVLSANTNCSVTIYYTLGQ